MTAISVDHWPKPASPSVRTVSRVTKTPRTRFAPRRTICTAMSRPARSRPTVRSPAGWLIVSGISADPHADRTDDASDADLRQHRAAPGAQGDDDSPARVAAPVA